MDALWVGIDPNPNETRILVMAGPSEIMLKARLRPHPQHSRAATSLLAPIRAARCAATPRPLSDSGSWTDVLLVGNEARLDEATRVPRRRPCRRDDLGLGDVRERAQLVPTGVAR